MSSALRTAEDDLLDAVATGTSDDPFAVLGRHETTLNGRPAVVIRTMQPAASARRARDGRWRHPDDAPAPDGTVRGRSSRWTAAIPRRSPTGSASTKAAARARSIDPYQFGQVLTDFDLHLLGEGTHYRAWEKLGPHRVTIGAVSGVHFAVWAPNAQRVSVIGDFNHWDGRVHVMRRLVPSGIWEIFIPDLTDGACYKFEVRTPAGHLLQKADPYARRFEVPPNTASVVWTEGAYQWGDDDWIRDRDVVRRLARPAECRSTRCTSARGAACRTKATAT